jgi:NTP pyrophosphatase (non-canonical NTP hydrolase)
MLTGGDSVKIEKMEGFNWVEIVSVAVSVIAVVFGGFWLKAKGKLALIADLVKEAYEVVSAFNEVIADNKIDKAEVERLKKEAADVKESLMALLGRK